MSFKITLAEDSTTVTFEAPTAEELLKLLEAYKLGKALKTVAKNPVGDSRDYGRITPYTQPRCYEYPPLIAYPNTIYCGPHTGYANSGALRSSS